MRKHAKYVWERDGGACRYCDFPGDEIDHVVSVAWRLDNSVSNLVLACRRCNALASGKVFESFEEKRDWLLTRRRKEILGTDGRIKRR